MNNELLSALFGTPEGIKLLVSGIMVFTSAIMVLVAGAAVIVAGRLSVKPQ